MDIMVYRVGDPAEILAFAFITMRPKEETLRIRDRNYSDDMDNGQFLMPRLRRGSSYGAP